jgi:GTP-dependent phosphoenolpyruvate carboxykinase
MAIEITSPSANESLLEWVADAIALCEPDHVQWCDGSVEEHDERRLS